jgi:hypothetical protein
VMRGRGGRLLKVSENSTSVEKVVEALDNVAALFSADSVWRPHRIKRIWERSQLSHFGTPSA